MIESYSESVKEDILKLSDERNDILQEKRFKQKLLN